MTRYRFLALAAPVLAVAVALSGCGVASRPAASVGGHAISLTSFQADLNHFRDNKDFRSVYQQSVGQPLAHTDGTVDARWSATWLSELVYLRLTSDMFRQRNLHTTSADEQAAQQQADQMFGTPTVFNSFPKSFRTSLLDNLTRTEADIRDVTKGETDQTSAQTKLSNTLLSSLRKAGVTVNHRFGTAVLTSQGFQIRPPTAPTVKEERGTTTTTGTPLLGTTPSG
jgi:hypothetical protein